VGSRWARMITSPSRSTRWSSLRARSVLRRGTMQQTANEQSFSNGRLTINFDGREVRLDGNLIRLTPTEYNLLQHLAQNVGKLVTHREMLSKLWGQEYVDATDYLKVHVLHLRRKLGDDPSNPTMIATERGIGYKFIA